MIFGDKTLVPYKNGLSSPKNASEGRNYPDFEYCIAPVHMKSKLVSAITNYSISSKKFIDGELKKTDGKHYELRNHFESLFDFEESTSKQIRVEIDTDSLSDDLYCLSNFDEKMLAVKPRSIHLILTESNPENARENIVGYCYFDDKREKREYSIKEGSDSLEILLPVNSEIFSNIFTRIESGDNTIYVSIYFPAYADTIDRMSTIIAPSTCVIDASYQGDNFAILQDITLSSGSIETNNETEEVENDYVDNSKEEECYQNIGDILFKTNDLSIKLHHSNFYLEKINSHLKSIALIMTVAVLLFIFNIFK
ncbi:hypothetical protein ABN335_20740 [Providencia rettgeri]